ncbi:hypothetical protein [Actinomycetospora sp. CA-053990]|uniref:hypothetical protein n=1 Tax=Actinomycetospora sp. CA-053990 TaxID=3239891 RepID=UPI003D8F8885
MGLAELGPAVPVLVVVVAGVLTALAMAPLHRRAAAQRRSAMLVDRVVTDRVARLSGPSAGARAATCTGPPTCRCRARSASRR